MHGAFRCEISRDRADFGIGIAIVFGFGGKKNFATLLVGYDSVLFLTGGTR